MKRKMPKVLLMLGLACVLVMGMAISAFAGDYVTESKTYEGGLTVDGSAGWNTADGDNYLVTEEGTFVSFTNNPFVSGTDNWCNFIIETVSSTEADGITLRADAYGWTYGDGVNTPSYTVVYDWEWDDFYTICTENTEVTVAAYKTSDTTVLFEIEFGYFEYWEYYIVTYPEGVPSELWFHIGADGAVVTINSVTYQKAVESVAVSYLATSEYVLNENLDLAGTELEITYEDGSVGYVTLGESSWAYDNYGNEFGCYLYSPDDDSAWFYWHGDTLDYAGTLSLMVDVYEGFGYYQDSYDTGLTVTVENHGYAIPDSAIELELNEIYQTNIEEEDGYVWYSFTPSYSAYYLFRSSNTEDDPYVELYVTYDGEELYYLTYSDDDGDGLNFLLKYYLEEGVTYYYKATTWSGSYVGIYDVTLVEGKEIVSVSAGDLTNTEYVQYVDYLDVTGTVVTVTYQDNTTAELIMNQDYAVDEYGNYINCRVLYKGEYYDSIRMPAGEYTVVFYTDDATAKDNTKTITVTAIEDSEYGCVVELLDTEYGVEVEGNGLVWFAFTPATNGQYYFVYSVDSDAAVQDYWCSSVRTYVFESYDEENDEYGFIYYELADEAYDADGNRVYAEIDGVEWEAYELKAGATYYIPMYYYGYTEDWLSDYSAATLTMLVGQVSHTHTYTAENIVWTWSEDHLSATATISCDGCGEALTGTATVTTETTEATATTDGSIVYTATVTLNGTVYTNLYTETIPATGEDATTADPEESSTTEDSSTTAADDSTATNTDSTGSTSPKTGDVATWGYYVMLLGAVAAAVVFARKKVNA